MFQNLDILEHMYYNNLQVQKSSFKSKSQPFSTSGREFHIVYYLEQKFFSLLGIYVED